MTRTYKRILVALTFFLVVICVSIFFLVKNANEILKSELEKSLGKDFHIGSIVLNWGSVDAYDIRLMRNGEEIAGAGKMSIRADFLGFLKRDYSLSSFSIEKPHLKILIDRQGELILPFIGAVKGAEGAAPKKRGTAFKIGSMAIDNGQIILIDERLPDDRNSITLKDLNISFKGLTYPFEDSMSSIKLSTSAEGRILSGRVSTEGKVNLKSGNLDMRMEGQNLVLLDLDKQGPIFSSESLSLSVATKEDRNGTYYFLDNVVLKKPYLRYETGDDGDLVSPWKEIIEELKRVSAPKATTPPGR